MATSISGRVVMLAVIMGIAVVGTPFAPLGAASGVGRTYTFDGDFDEGTLLNVVHSTPDQLQLDETVHAFNVIWIAVSTKGTVVKIDTDTGAIVGEYWTSPAGQAKNPSRTTVDLNGNVWASNRDGNSVLQIGLAENNQCVDRNGNGIVETSTGLGDIRPWTNAGGADTLGGVTTADDECILQYVRVSSFGTRHVSVNADNDVWVSGTGGQRFDLIDGPTGTIVRTEPSVGHGGYGGLVDPNGVIWSARPLLRWDTALPLTGPNGLNWLGFGHDSYGLCIDAAGNVWETALSGNLIRKWSPAGTLLGTFSHGFDTAQGCVVDGNGHVWVAHSLLGGNSIGHLRSDGTHVGNVLVGNGPTGVAVDGAGKIWSTNYHAGTASRIDPAAGPLGSDGLTLVGAVDFVTPHLGGNPYDYSDMTGSTLTGAPPAGTWTVVYDSGVAGLEWGKATWTADVFGDGSVEVRVASSNDGIAYSPYQLVSQGVDMTVPNGQYLMIQVALERSSDGDSPIVYDLTVAAANEAPDCGSATAGPATLWPPNHRMVAVAIGGVSDADGDGVTITVDSIRQDEVVNGPGDGATSPDGAGVGTPTASVRAERAGTPKAPGDGRVYHIGFTADDGNGGSCTGTVRVAVPHDMSRPPIDGGPLYVST